MPHCKLPSGSCELCQKLGFFFIPGGGLSCVHGILLGPTSWLSELVTEFVVQQVAV